MLRSSKYPRDHNSMFVEATVNAYLAEIYHYLLSYSYIYTLMHQEELIIDKIVG